MPCWLSELTRRTRTKIAVGRRSPTLLYIGWAATLKASSSCFGAHMLRKKGPQLTGCATAVLLTQTGLDILITCLNCVHLLSRNDITSCRQCTLLLCLLTEAFLDASISLRPTSCWRNRESLPLIGRHFNLFNLPEFLTCMFSASQKKSPLSLTPVLC